MDAKVEERAASEAAQKRGGPGSAMHEQPSSLFGPPKDQKKPSILDQPGPQYHSDIAIDNLMSITLELGAALWEERTRVRTIEALLAEKAGISLEDIETYKMSADAAKALSEDRDAFIQRLYGVLKVNTG